MIEVNNIGGFGIREPKLVVKLAIACDSIHLEQLPRLWMDAEKDAATRLPRFSAENCFFQERSAQGEMLYSFRYYTPSSNLYVISADENGGTFQ